VSRAGAIAAVIALAACAAKVDPRSPFDVDDPRALREDVERAAANDAAGGRGPDPDAAGAPAADAAAAGATSASALPVPVPGAGARGGTVLRAELAPVLDAGPAAFLAWFEAEAATDGDRFAGWRLVKLLPAGRALAALDLVPGDVVVAVNGRPLSRPDELGDLWAELYRAGAIVAEVHRGGERFTLRYTISGPPLPAPPPPPR
jgi:S1-C subfamily serine protease